jgi:chemotaxis protein methyltransferase CheR
MVSAFDFDYLRALVRSHSGVVLEPHKDYLARLHLNRLVLQTGCESLAAFIEHLKRSSPGSLHQQAVEALLINETSFFRDYSPFETLKSRILPTLIRSRPAQQPIYIWCAACSNGQEPYSIAILIQEAFPDLANGKVRVIASDLSACVLDRAKRGEYTNLEISRGLSPTLRDRYFQQVGQSWQINHEIRQTVEFRQLNLIHAWTALPKMDVIFLRNVLIYLDIPTKQAILDRVRGYLQPDGYLFLGSGETTFHIDPSFEAVHSETSLYYRLRSSY